MNTDVIRLEAIGALLRNYRQTSGLRADEIAQRLGVSRAALYRYEKGEVIKLDTIQRLATLLQISTQSLLGIAVEYYGNAADFFERLHGIEASAEQIWQIAEPLAALQLSSDCEALLEGMRRHEETGAQAEGRMMGESLRLTDVLARRYRVRAGRNVAMISMITEHALIRLLRHGIGEGISVPSSMREHARIIAANEVLRMADLIERAPMGVQIGVFSSQQPSGNCILMRGHATTALAINPFRSDAPAGMTDNVAIITASPDAIGAHQTMLESVWRDALQGPAAAARVRELVSQYGVRGAEGYGLHNQNAVFGASETTGYAASSAAQPVREVAQA